MEGTLSRTAEPVGGPSVRSASDWTLTDAAFTFEQDDQANRHRVTFDTDRAPPSLAVLTVVSTISGIDPMELDPLSECIDPDALDALLTAGRSSDCRVAFRYGGYELTVEADGLVVVVE